MEACAVEDFLITVLDKIIENKKNINIFNQMIKLIFKEKKRQKVALDRDTKCACLKPI